MWHSIRFWAILFLGLFWIDLARAEEKGSATSPLIQLKDYEIPLAPSQALPVTNRLKPLRQPGYSQLSSAYWSGGPNAVAALLANGADPNAQGPKGEPILQYAVWLGHLEKLEDLLRAGANPNLPGKGGSTPLASAVWNGKADVVSMLLQYGADPQQKGEGKTSAVEDAVRYGRKDLEAILLASVMKKTVRPYLPPVVLRKPAKVFGSARFRAAAGGQALAYSNDGKTLYAGDEGGAIRFLDSITGEIRNVIDAHDWAVTDLAPIPNSPLLVSTGDDRFTRFFNTKTSREVKRLRLGSKGLAVSPNGKWIFNGYHLWQVESLEPFRLADLGYEMKVGNVNVGVHGAFFTPDSRFLVMSRNTDGLWVCDVEDKKTRKVEGFDAVTVQRITGRDLAGAVGGKPVPEGLLALAASQYTFLAGPPKILKAFDPFIPRVIGEARALACSPDGQFLASLGYDSRIDIYDMEKRGKKFEHEGHTTALLSVAVSPNGKLIASGGNDLKARIWDRQSGKQIAQIDTASFIYSLCFSPDSKVLAIGDNSSNFYLWEIETRKLHSHHTSGRVTSLAFHRDILVSLGDELHLFDWKADVTRARISGGEAGQGNIAVDPQGLIVGTARSVAAGEMFKVPEAWKWDGKRITACRQIFSAAMGHYSFIDGVAFSPDGDYLAASSSGAIRLWDMKERKAVGEKMCGHSGSPHTLRFSPDGRWLASGSWDGTARIWDIPSGKQALVLDADVARVSGVAFTPDGCLVTANWDGTVHLWDLKGHLPYLPNRGR